MYMYCKINVKVHLTLNNKKFKIYSIKTKIALLGVYVVLCVIVCIHNLIINNLKQL